jgi:hypothetical protein
MHLMLVDDGHVDALTDVVGAKRPDVVAVRQRDTRTLRPWPGWDDGLMAFGYAPCLFTGSWRLYVSAARADEVGPRLSFPAQPDELAMSDTHTRDELVKEVVRWRTAALSRWADGAVKVHLSTNHAAEKEVEHLRTILDDTHATVSWRITRPLRAIQSRRLRHAHR